MLSSKSSTRLDIVNNDKEPCYLDHKVYEIVVAKFRFDNHYFHVALLDYEEALQLAHLEEFLDKQTLQICKFALSGLQLKEITVEFFHDIKARETTINTFLQSLPYAQKEKNISIIDDINLFFKSCFSTDISKETLSETSFDFDFLKWDCSNFF